MMMVEKIDLTNLPSDVISNVASFMVGKPEELRLKHNKALKKIRRKFKPHFTEVKEREYENVMQLIVGHLENKQMHTRNKFIYYDLIQGKFSQQLPLFMLINREQTEKMKNIILKEIPQIINNGNYRYIKRLSVIILRFYADENTVPEHLQCIHNRGKFMNIKNIENLDIKLEEIIRDKLGNELDFHIEHGDIEIYSYRFMVEFEFEKII